MISQPEDFSTDSMDEVRERLNQITSVEDASVLRQLQEMIADPARAEVVREDAARALGRCNSAECREILNTLARDSDPILRQLAAAGMGDDASEETILALIDMLTDDVNKVRNVAERSLLKRTAQLAETGVEPLLKLFSHANALTRSPAARLIGQTQDPRGLEPLLTMLQSDNWLERLWAAKGLGDLGQDEAIAPLVQLMQSDDKNRVRASAVDALSVLRPENLEEMLQGVLESESDEGVLKTANEALLALGFEATDTDFDPFAED